MLTPQSVLRFTIELIFVFLGVIVVWLGLTGRVLIERHRPSWFILSAALVLWGLRALYGTKSWWARWENWTRGLSLILLGLVMLAISRVPFLWIGPLLVAAGVVLAVRGIIGGALVWRPR
jgi:hypothetical protein